MHKVTKNGVYNRRIRKYDAELKVFTTAQLKDKINNSPASVNGKEFSKKRRTKFQLDSNRLSSLLLLEPNIIKKNEKKSSYHQIWEWVE
jgi:hypothetical protein